jgi:hypothetical protein
MVLIPLAFIAGTYTSTGCGGSSSPAAPVNVPTSTGGRVIDRAAGSLVTSQADAIRLTQGSHTIVSPISDTGSWFIEGVQPGAASISVTVPGYKPFSRNLVLVQGRNTFDILLEK